MKRARRVLLAALAAALCAPFVEAQSVRRVAILDNAAEGTRADSWQAFRRRLSELGWVEGKNVAVQSRYAAGDLSKLDALAAETVAQKADVIVAATTTVAIAAKRATSDIAIVALGPADPVKSGLVASLARPGGNLTGTAMNQREIAGKWLDLVREIVPGAKSVGYLTDLGNPGEMLVFRELESQGATRGIVVREFNGVTADSVDETFRQIAQKRLDAMIVATTSMVLPQRAQIVDGAARARIPAVYARREYLAAGGLVSYGSDFDGIYIKGAEYVDRILRGAKPADLPFEMASTFQLVVNLKAAQALGLAIPQSVRIRADEVMQ